MCSVNAIKLIVMILSYLKVVFMLYVFAIGCYFASSSDFQQAFGTQFIEYGLSLIFLALLSLALIYPFKYGVNRHNRFIMIFTFIFETVVFAELINYSTILSSYTVSEFDQSLQLDCLRAKPEIYTKEECEPFLKSDRTAGFRLVWSSYFTKREQKIPYQILTRIQEQDCCGFFAPIRCAANNDSFPSNRETKGISSALLERRVTCSIHDPTYYPEQSDCQDGPEFPDIVLGCKYDLGVGFCLGKNVIDETKGCAYYMELYVNGLINPHTPTLIVCACFNFFYMLLACCMWWKRKHTDVFPTFSGGKKVKTHFHSE